MSICFLLAKFVMECLSDQISLLKIRGINVKRGIILVVNGIEGKDGALVKAIQQFLIMG